MGWERVSSGLPHPPGVTPTPDGVNVSVHAAAAATAVDLCLFPDDAPEVRIRLPERTGQVFHGHVAGVRAGARYGLRVHGPYDPAAGLRFDPGKLLVDPYVRALDRPFALHDSLFTPPEAGADSAPHVPRGIVTATPAPRTPALVRPWEGTVIYEAHVRGLTRLHPGVPEDIRGTFAALGHPAIINHLKALGVTTLELLPTAAWIDERRLAALGLVNYWGYNPVALCAPDPRLAPGGWDEVRTAVEALAREGIETLLDVVFNHTGEGDEFGPTVSLRGLDNPGYYRLRPDDAALYVNDAGTGNILACDRPQVVQLVTEALRTWARLGGVAGFRFDLATVLGRRPEGFDPHAPLLSAIQQDPELRALKLVAEPWDCGPGGYQLGRFPDAWGEWNDRFRDTVRRFWRGRGETPGILAARLAGSQDQFAGRRRPSRSINFVAAHDGFTLADMVSYARRHNEANGEGNRDGSADEVCWSHGTEGPTQDPAILSRRLSDQRALLTLLFAARGTPMIPMGAELGHTQGGNNNAYAQDNSTSWLSWAGGDAGLTAFVGRLAAARARHPALSADRFLNGAAGDSPWPDVAWARFDGEPMSAADWDDAAGPGLQMTLAATSADGALDRVVLMVNRSEDTVAFGLPEGRDGWTWQVLADSADPDRPETPEAALPVAARSVVLLAEAPAPGRPATRAGDDRVKALAAAAGIAEAWWSLQGERTETSVQTQRALLQAMRLPAETAADVRDSLWRLQADSRRALPRVTVRQEDSPGRAPVQHGDSWLVIEPEQGGAPIAAPVREGWAELPRLAAGRYRLRAGGETGELIVAPARAFEPAALAAGQRLYGLSTQLYAVRRQGDAGVGDFTTLRRLGALASAAGAGVLSLNPLHALPPPETGHASPYYPSDRRAVEPLYLDLPGAPPQAADLIDYPRIRAAKAAAADRAVAEALATPQGQADLQAFLREAGAWLHDACAFEVLRETYGPDWRVWPESLRSPNSPGVAEVLQAHPQRLRQHQAVQWLCDRQLAQAAASAPGIGLCRDLAVGAAPGGSEAWAAGDRLAAGVSIGAPPDAFAPQGQVWGLPPPDPHRWRAEAYRSFQSLLAANMRHAGALRIDHVLGLARLFWVPEGADGRDGAYVAYPLEDLLAVLALESQDRRCLVIGEDLGTVPDHLRAALDEAGVYRYSVLPFERDGQVFKAPAAYPERALACAATHDLPPLAGWWSGADLRERAELGLLDDDAQQAAQADRVRDKTALLAALAAEDLLPASEPTPDSPFSDALCAAIHAFVARAPSRLAMVQLEDLAGETLGVNLPGTHLERPNWRHRLALDLDELAEGPRWQAVLAAVRAER